MSLFMRKARIAAQIVAILLVVWVGMSFVDIVAHNMNSSPSYGFWNLFEILYRGYRGL